MGAQSHRLAQPAIWIELRPLCPWYIHAAAHLRRDTQRRFWRSRGSTGRYRGLYAATCCRPAPAPKSYLVFFDFNKSDLTPQATEIVDTAAKNAGPAKVTQLTVTGHTDTVGSDAYNMRLSRRLCGIGRGAVGEGRYSLQRDRDCRQRQARPAGPDRRRGEGTAEPPRPDRLCRQVRPPSRIVRSVEMAKRFEHRLSPEYPPAAC